MAQGSNTSSGILVSGLTILFCLSQAHQADRLVMVVGAVSMLDRSRSVFCSRDGWRDLGGVDQIVRR